MGYPFTSPQVYEVLKAHEGEEVTVATIVEHTGLTRQQVLNSLGNLRRERNIPIEVVIRGYSCRLLKVNPSQENVVDSSMISVVQPVTEISTKRTFEEVAVTRTGAIVAKDAKGILYKVEELVL